MPSSCPPHNEFASSVDPFIAPGLSPASSLSGHDTSCPAFRFAGQSELYSVINPLHHLDGGGSMAKPIPNQPSSTPGKRRSRRFPFISPVEATWQEANGKIFREAGQATEVNAQGGLLEMKAYPAAGTQIELTNLTTHETSQA